MALRHTGAKIDLLTDPDAYLMIENSLRGGIATISRRYASANNHLVKNHDKSKPSRFTQIVYTLRNKENLCQLEIFVFSTNGKLNISTSTRSAQTVKLGLL